MKKSLLIVGILWLTIAVTAQSTTCSEIVLQAINQVDSLCQDIARNQICYGHQSVIASPAANVSSLNFNNPGSIEELNRIASFNLSQLDEAAGIWGIGVLKVQANLPDTTPGVNVTILTFGDVNIAPDDGKMQAFALSTGIGQISCSELPDSGVVIQTPEGVGTVQFNINGVDLALGSTLYIQAVDRMWISVLEGEATVSNLGVTETVAAGEYTTVQLDDNGEASSAPTISQRYSAEDIRGLPIELLPQEIEVVPGISTAPAFTGVTCPYIVRSGENLYRIALNSGSTVTELVELNNLSDPTRIYAGQQLLLPACIIGTIPAPITSTLDTTVTITPTAEYVDNCYPEIVNYCDPGRPWGDGRCISDDQSQTDYNYIQGWYAAAVECGVIDPTPAPVVIGGSCSVDAPGGRIIYFALDWDDALSGQDRVRFSFNVYDANGGLHSVSEEQTITSGQTSLSVQSIMSYQSYQSGAAYILDANGQSLIDPISCDP